MKRRWALVAVHCFLLSSIALGVESLAAVRPGDLDLKVTVTPNYQPGLIENAQTTDLGITVINKSNSYASGHLVVTFPSYLGRDDKRQSFSVRRGGQQEHRLLVTLPAGKPQPVNLVMHLDSSSGERLLTMDVLLTKSGAWKVIGPFEGNTRDGLDRVFPPEEGIDLEAVYTGRGNKKVRWQAFDPDAVDEKGYFDLNKALGSTENATAYATMRVTAPSERKAFLLLGSDDGVKVWHNGNVVHTNAIHRGSAPGQDEVPLTLAEGRNEFMLKVCNDDGGWGFHFNIVDEHKSPFFDLESEAGISRIFLRDTKLRVINVTGGSCELTWKSDEPVASKLTVVEADPGRALVYDSTPKDKMNKPLKGKRPYERVEKVPTTDHVMPLLGLNPGTRYLAWAEPALGGEPTPAICFYTDPPGGRMQYLVLKVATVIFANTTPPGDKDRPGARDPCPLEMIERVKEEMEQAILFYWITTGMRVLLDVDYYVTYDYCEGKNEAYGVGFGGEDEEAFKKLLKEAGKSVDEYDGRNFVSMEKRWDDQKKAWHYPASGGGTIGPEAWPGYGKSAWKGSINNHWLFCHEFHHQFDALYHYSQGPEHLFCHFQPWDDTAHRHGEHWDGIAWVLLEWAGYVTREHQGRPYLEPELGYRYFINRWGRVYSVADKDGDGIPDDDPRVPVDEKRFGSDPAMMDTDEDGLTDMMEVLACHWVEYGHSEIWAGDKESHYADPTNPDTDGDGLEDGKDPYPIYAIDPVIPYNKPDHPFAKMRDPACDADFTLGWDDEFLYIGIATKEAPEEVKIFLDLDDDGWFVGADNYDIRVRDGVSFQASFHNCGVKGKWPFYEEGRIEAGKDVLFQSQIEKESFALEIKVPRNKHLGLDLEYGEKIGILIALGPKGGNGRVGKTGALTLFEPQTFFTFTLKE